MLYLFNPRHQHCNCCYNFRLQSNMPKPKQKNVSKLGRTRAPKLLPDVLQAIVDIGDRNGSTEKKVKDQIQALINASHTKPRPKNLEGMVQYALRYALKKGVIDRIGTKYKLAVGPKNCIQWKNCPVKLNRKQNLNIKKGILKKMNRGGTVKQKRKVTKAKANRRVSKTNNPAKNQLERQKEDHKHEENSSSGNEKCASSESTIGQFTPTKKSNQQVKRSTTSIRKNTELELKESTHKPPSNRDYSRASKFTSFFRRKVDVPNQSPESKKGILKSTKNYSNTSSRDHLVHDSYPHKDNTNCTNPNCRCNNLNRNFQY